MPIAPDLPASCVDDDMLALLLARFARGELSAQMTLMYWLKARRGVAQIEATLAHPSADPAWQPLADMLRANRAGCERIAAMIAADVDTDAAARTPEEGIAFCRRLFDWSVRQSSESSVALYSLGNPALLAAATREVVDWLQQQGLIAPTTEVLDIGCGIGRFEVALADRVARITGIDVSTSMIEQARQRCAALPNVRLRASSGQDLAAFADASVDLVLAVDSFPYLFQSGWALLARHFEEAARVLRPGGALAIFELSYGRSLEADAADFARLVAQAGLRIGPPPSQPFAQWDGIAFVAFR